MILRTASCFISLIIVLVSCSTTSNSKTDINFSWNDDLMAYEFNKTMFLGKKTSLENKVFYQNLSEKKIKSYVDIDLKPDFELQKALQSHGISYVHASFFCDENQKTFCPNTVTSEIKKLKEGHIYVTCNHGTKAGAWFSIYNYR